jgi:hypothetical protein
MCMVFLVFLMNLKFMINNKQKLSLNATITWQIMIKF